MKNLEPVDLNGILKNPRGCPKKAKMKFLKLRRDKSGNFQNLPQPWPTTPIPSPNLAMGDFRKWMGGLRARPRPFLGRQLAMSTVITVKILAESGQNFRPL